MNEELQKQLAVLLASLMSVASDAARFAGNQIPALILEKIAFGRAWETTAFVLLIALAGCLGYATLRLYRLAIEHQYSDWGVGAFFAGLGGAAAVAVAVSQLQNVLLVWFAPRLYIVEWLKGMVGK